MAEKNSSPQSLWEKHLENWMDSGLSVVSWCRENQISSSQFYYWRQKLLSPTPRSKDSFIELEKDKPGEGALLLKWGSLELHLSRDFDTLCLERCLKVIKDF